MENNNEVKATLQKLNSVASSWDEGDFIPFPNPSIKHESDWRIENVAANLVECILRRKTQHFYLSYLNFKDLRILLTSGDWVATARWIDIL